MAGDGARGVMHHGELILKDVLDDGLRRHKEQANEVITGGLWSISVPLQLSLLWSELMGDRSPVSEICPTAVAIDKDKNSQHAVKWAVDHLIKTRIVVLIHVRSKSSSRFGLLGIGIRDLGSNLRFQISFCNGIGKKSWQERIEAVEGLVSRRDIEELGKFYYFLNQGCDLGIELANIA
ncbi:hypothetical protein MA16_Dca005556 [Dendrobium catenatum]|uniref:UspA domain-containing protein n=1 Tax=Dendrobium catenatum TaxID=906689 RepID=A0A2I0WPY1_9ASPA|nr:hypothetical protein MA16_Dca005556 [Dendrobium catenatum]